MQPTDSFEVGIVLGIPTGRPDLKLDKIWQKLVHRRVKESDSCRTLPDRIEQSFKICCMRSSEVIQI